MLNQLTFWGIDPGLIHTGIVRIDMGRGTVNVVPFIIDGFDALAIARLSTITYGQHVYIEDYRIRGNLGTNIKMLDGIRFLRSSLTSTTMINNMGVKQVVRKPLMELFNVWSYSTSTHHQDLRSAARIGLFGALKNNESNEFIAHMARKILISPQNVSVIQSSVKRLP